MLDSLASRRRTVVGGLLGTARSLAAAAAHRLAGPTIIVVPGTADAEAVRDDLRAILGDVLYFPAYETMPWAEEPAHPGVISDRVECLCALAAARPGSVAVAPAAALVKRVPAPGDLPSLRLYSGMRMPLEELEAWLVAAGYDREPSVWEQARWARRGGIVDVASIGMENPVRLEMMGDTLESIRTFDLRSQRSIRRLRECTLLPAREAFLTPDHWNSAMERLPEDHPLSERLWSSNSFPGIEHHLPLFLEGLAGFLDYLPEDGTLVVMDGQGVRTHADDALAFYREGFAEAGLPFGLDEQFLDMAGVEESVRRSGRLLELEPYPGESTDVDYPTVPQESFVGHREEMVRRLSEWSLEGRVAVLCDSRAEMETFSSLLPEGLDVGLAVLPIAEGFRMPDAGIAVLAERRLLSRRRRPERIRRFRGGEAYAAADDIAPGSLVVHERYGIGRFRGLERVETSGTVLDCLAIEYRGGDRLLVPMSEIGSVQRYMAPEKASPRLDVIGGTSWEGRVSRARRRAREIAGRLAALYAERKAMRREPPPPPSRLVASLEESFPYEETPDQMKTIRRVMGDFDTDLPMDRLVCGDVGYGKTEVAVRAAFRACDAGRQVAVLVPTTVLAEQHYNTFSDRLAEFPVRVEMLSRFRSRAEQRETLRRLAEGEVDIVVGTHRLLQKDVRFHDLGLLVIDEEHRFGVRQKEYIREMRTSVDTLSMTATPIPRTLHMALSGFRDISLITTPPRDRYPIHTEIARFDPGLVARAVGRELERGGQVFFVHNRIHSIHGALERLERALPGVRIAVGHGQMPPGELESVMHGFMEGDFDILLSTAIIESGLDLPRVNTIFIDDAHTFGLAELYQLRGRVGRSHHQAYCYLLIPGLRRLPPEARARLDAIQRYTQLGSGWSIAMRDLELRGAGELLGASQHGQMISIGYAMFEELLRQESRRLEGMGEEVRRTVRVEIPGETYIPESYMPDVADRVRMYRAVWRAGSEEAIDGWLESLRDRWGDPDQPVLSCARRARVHLLARRAGAEEVVVSGGAARIVFPPESLSEGYAFPGSGVRLEVEPTGRAVLRVSVRGVDEEAAVSRIADVLRHSPKVTPGL